MIADRHGGSFEVVERDAKNVAVTWLATCVCGEKWGGPTYEAVEDRWREHVHSVRGRAPRAHGDQKGRWQPNSARMEVL